MTSKHHQREVPLFLAAAVAVVSGCNFIVEPDRAQCDTNADCTSRGPAFADTECVRSVCQKVNPWACLDAVQTPAPNNGPYKVIIRTTFIVGSAPIAGSRIELCNRIELDCANPLNPDPAITNDDGEAELSVNHNFTGYVKVTPPDRVEEDKYVPGYYFFNPGVTSEMTVAVQIATFGLATALTTSLESPQRDDRGLALINALGCDGIGAAGVVFKSELLDDDSVTFYAEGSLPVRGLTATTTSGFGGFINMKAGTGTIIGELQENNRRMGSSAVYVNPKAITYTRLVPIGLPP